MEDPIMELYLAGKLKKQSDIQKACRGDPYLLGAVMVKIQNHRSQQNAAAEVSGESNASATASTAETHQAESEGIREDGKGDGETEGKREKDAPKQPRRRVPRKVRVSSDKSEKSENDVPGYGCFQHLRKRCCCLRFFW